MNLFGGLRRALLHFSHKDFYRPGHAEKIISVSGGFLGILLILLVSGRVLDFHGAALVVASMGASAVLLFATPHSPLSQPWSVIGGQIVSAAIGVTCAKTSFNPLYASALGVALSIGAMYYLRCLHPPGGATALVAVLGGDPVHALGYGFLLTPVLVNVVIILAVAIVTNYPFHWRRYPQWLAHKAHVTSLSANHDGEKCMIAHSDLVYALSEIDSFIDISEEDLLQIYQLAVRHTHALPNPNAIR
ncbi:MAG TPA: HPP family protein [Parasulfuritortus sp.]